MKSLRSCFVCSVAAFFAMAGVVLAADGEAEAIKYTVYGKLHASLDSLDDGDENDTYLSSNSSRIGFKGDAAVQDGLKMIWQVETEARIDEAGTTFSTRDSFVGLDTVAGKVVYGRVDSPCKTLSRKTDLFGDQIGDTRNILGVGAGVTFDPRLDSAVMYTTPKVAGFCAAAAYRAPEAIENSDAMSASLTWTTKDEGLMIAAAYEQHGEMFCGTDTNRDKVIDVAASDIEQAIRGAATYKIGDLKLSALYEHVIDAAGVAGADRDTVGGGAAYTIKQFTLKGQYYSSGETDGKPGTGADMLAGGVDYAMLKNAIVYLAYAQTMNDEAAKVSMSGGGHGNKVTPLVGGKDLAGISLGMIYSF